ncbi:unnamed protein product [Miscanthus lutarioriparius]|uniref:cellulase n=1 Tax=Miscanthus lutarioriparius TaxID=422564 RepID=A0A811N7A9_9POAL|nr:unnamed protein product [Miscanthus lutarioriparius]
MSRGRARRPPVPGSVVIRAGALLLLLLASAVLLAAASSPSEEAAVDYGAALSKSLLYFEAQRSGGCRTTSACRGVATRASPTACSKVDLVGGYYDAGDHVKFGLPMAFTVTMLAWGAIDFADDVAAAGESGATRSRPSRGHRLLRQGAHRAVRLLGRGASGVRAVTGEVLSCHFHAPPMELGWIDRPRPKASDIMQSFDSMKAAEIYCCLVGDGDTDHYCWQRPEDMTTTRAGVPHRQGQPGSDLAGETAAALAAASIVFRRSNPHYSRLLLHHAQQLFEFGDRYRGTYDSSIAEVRSYYASVSGYQDELLWAALWLHTRHGPRRLPPLRRRQGRLLRRGRLGHDRVQLGRQVRRRPGPRSQGTVLLLLFRLS